MKPLVLAVAKQNCVRPPGDNRRHERRDSSTVLNRKGRRRHMPQRKAESALDAVVKASHGPAIATRGLPATAIVPILLGTTTATILTAFGSSGRVCARLSHSLSLCDPRLSREFIAIHLRLLCLCPH
jgi:hypothetical protein